MDRAALARTVQYNCTKTDGTGTAGPHLTPLFQAWASSKRLLLVSGTLNLCAHRDVVLPNDFVRLKPWDSVLGLTNRKQTPGYDPRLYFAALDGKQPVWVFRWSDNAHLENFVSDTPGCSARRRCEVVAETHLSSLWPLDGGEVVTLHFK
jgi:hypothetical protein